MKQGKNEMEQEKETELNRRKYNRMEREKGME